MAKAIGLSRKIKLQWLNKAVELLGENLAEEEYKAKMNEYLSFEIESPTVLRKTREILMRVWFYEDDADVVAVRKDALQLIRMYPDCDIEIHWCMLLMVYPVFADVANIMGRIVDFNDVVTVHQLKQKLYDEWGERTTLYHSVDKIIATIKELGLLSSCKRGTYSVVERKVIKPSVVALMVRVAMQVENSGYYSITDLKSFDILFPFEFEVSKELLIESNGFIVTRFGEDIAIAMV